MTTNNDDVIARLQATLRAVADRTPIGEARSIDYPNLPAGGQARSRTAVTVVSAAAAVAAIAAVSTVVAGSHRSHTVSPGAGGLGAPASSAPASPAPVASTVPTPTPTSVPTPVRSISAGSAVPVASPCVPENYYVVASPAQLTGLTYLLPSTPPGYTFYGAWGTISANNCPGSQTWYVEYDESADMQTNISISVRPADNVTPTVVASVATATVHGHEAAVLGKGQTYGVVVWQADGLDFDVAGPMAGGNPESLVALANALTAVSPTDPRIVAPLNCRIAPGNTCPEGSQPTPTVTPTPTPTK